MKEITNIPRIWIQKDISHPYKLPGLQLINHFQETISAIALIREHEDHASLSSLEKLLSESIDEYILLSGDISKAEVWIKDLTDILLGKKNKKGERNTERCKQRMSKKRVKKKFEAYVFDLIKEKEKHSPLLQEFIDHVRKTHNNWKKYLYTCYDFPFLPNTNLELELSHSRMKRVHRKISGKKHSQRFLLLYGEKLAFVMQWELTPDTLSSLLEVIDQKELQQRTNRDRMKSRRRGKNRRIITDITCELQRLIDKWRN